MTRTRLIPLLIAAALATFAVACGGSGSKPSTPKAGPFPGDTWQLVYNVSGGFDGRDYSLTLASSGAATVEDRRSKRNASRTLDAAELTKLGNLLAGSGIDGPQPTRNDACADCVDVAVTVTTGGKTYTGKVNEVNKQPRLDPLLAELRQLYEANKP